MSYSIRKGNIVLASCQPLDIPRIIYHYSFRLYLIRCEGKFLGTLGEQSSCAPFSYVHDEPHHEFNDWTLL